MTRVWDGTAFKGDELLVLLCLADHASDDGYCWPSFQRLADRVRCSRRHAIRCVERLKAEGWLTVEGSRKCPNGQFVNVYQLHIPEGGDIPDTKNKGSDICDNQVVTFEAQVVTPVSPKPSLEPPKEPSLCRADALRWDSSVSLEDAHDHVLAITGLNPIHAVLCSQSWLKTAISAQDWRESLSGFASSFEREAVK